MLGIGFNLYPPENGFPKEITSVAGTVFQERQIDGQNRIAAGFLNRFVSCYQAGYSTDYIINTKSAAWFLARA